MNKEVDRFAERLVALAERLIQDVMDRRFTAAEMAKYLGLTQRQWRRWVAEDSELAKLRGQDGLWPFGETVGFVMSRGA